MSDSKKNVTDSSLANVNPASDSASTRRIPQQVRSLKTIEIILRATGEEIERVGLGKLTTKRIATAAGLSVGGLYEYFPNKEAIVNALARQWLKRVVDAIDSVHPVKTGCKDLIRYLGMTSDVVRPLYTKMPGVGGLVTLLSSIPELHAVEQEIDLRVNALISDAISHLLPHLPTSTCRVMARTLTILDHRLLCESVIHDPDNAPQFDTYRRVCQYALATHLMLMHDQARIASQAAGAPTPDEGEPRPVQNGI